MVLSEVKEIEKACLCGSGIVSVIMLPYLNIALLFCVEACSSRCTSEKEKTAAKINAGENFITLKEIALEVLISTHHHPEGKEDSGALWI